MFPIPPGYRHCPECGVAVQRAHFDAGLHECDPERYARHQSRKLTWRRSGFEAKFAAWLQTPRGRFAQFYARRRILGQRGSAGP
jgi:hypothetical protein